VTARDEILRRVRAALADVPGTPDDEVVPRDYRRSHHTEELVGLFAERVADYRAEVRRIRADELHSSIVAVLGSRTVVVPPDVPDAWIEGLSVRRDSPALSVAELDTVDGVLTGCALGIAETGTIVLDTGVAQGRRAITLVPDLHVCVVHEDQVVADLPDAIDALDPNRPLTWISGPSATSDIELERVEGVHGPRTLIVLLVESG
jgi:L-lactate dehydrogenase complex protein LldG